MARIRIVSDGSASNTHVYDEHGKEMEMITSVVIHPIKPGLPITVELTVIDVELDITAERLTADKPVVDDGVEPMELARRMCR